MAIINDCAGQISKKNNTLVRFIGSFILTITLTGCATHSIVPPNPPISSEKYTLKNHRSISLSYGIDYADRMSAQYYELLRQDITSEIDLGRFLILIGGAVLGLAAFDAHTDAITGAALIGGTGYALGTWNKSSDRRGIYLEGIKAMYCAKKAMEPLDFSGESLANLKWRQIKLELSENELAEAIKTVKILMALVEGEENDKNNKLLKTAESDLVRTYGELEQALATSVKGEMLYRAINGAGRYMSNRIDGMVYQINRALEGTVADLAQLPEFVKQLNSFTQIFAPEIDLDAIRVSRLAGGAKGVAGNVAVANAEATGIIGGIMEKPSKQSSNSSALAIALGILEQRRLRVVSAYKKLNGIADSVDRSKVSEALKSCGVEVANTTSDISLSTTQISFTKGVADTYYLRVTGGTKGYWAQFNRQNTPGLSLRNPRPDESTIQIIADTKSVIGEYPLTVGDAAGHEKTVTLQVIENGGENSGGTGGKGVNSSKQNWTSFLKGNEVALFNSSIDNVKKAQKMLCIPEIKQDGLLGDYSRLTIKVANEEFGLGSTDLYGRDLETAISTQGECKPGRLNRSENGLAEIGLCHARINLGLSVENKIIDEEMRNVLKAIANGSIELNESQKVIKTNLKEAITDSVSIEAMKEGMLSKHLVAWLIASKEGIDYTPCGN